MKIVRIRNTAIASDILTCKIYHTSINEDNLLTSSISASGVFTGEDLYNGLTFEVNDSVSQFYVKNLTRCVNIGSGSLTENSNVVEFYYVDPGSGGSVSVYYESGNPITTSPGTYRHNFSVSPYLSLTINPTYPNEFQAWYSNSAFTGSALSTNNPVTITSGSFNSNTTWYAKYS